MITQRIFKSWTSKIKGSFAWDRRLRRGPNCNQMTRADNKSVIRCKWILSFLEDYRNHSRSKECAVKETRQLLIKRTSSGIGCKASLVYPMKGGIKARRFPEVYRYKFRQSLYTSRKYHSMQLYKWQELRILNQPPIFMPVKTSLRPLIIYHFQKQIKIELINKRRKQYE